jgi:hypothetical protein
MKPSVGIPILTLLAAGLVLFSHFAAGQDAVMRAAVSQPPPYCQPCLFYAGDFDPNNSEATGLLNENVVGQSVGTQLFVPFKIPKGETWFLLGAFINQLANVDLVDPPLTPWTIVNKTQATVCSGKASATFTPTGRSAFDLIEYTLLIRPVYCALPAGTYWLSVLPQCTNQNDNNCSHAAYYESDVEDRPPLNHYGPLQPWDASFYCSETCSPAWGTNGPCQGIGCDRFSAGLLGIKKTDSPQETTDDH